MIQNSCAIAGIGCVVYSAYLVGPALAFLVGGVSLLVIGLGAAKVAAAKKVEALKKHDR